MKIVKISMNQYSATQVLISMICTLVN